MSNRDLHLVHEGPIQRVEGAGLHGRCLVSSVEGAAPVHLPEEPGPRDEGGLLAPRGDRGTLGVRGARGQAPGGRWRGRTVFGTSEESVDAEGTFWFDLGGHVEGEGLLGVGLFQLGWFFYVMV